MKVIAILPAFLDIGMIKKIDRPDYAGHRNFNGYGF